MWAASSYEETPSAPLQPKWSARATTLAILAIILLGGTFYFLNQQPAIRSLTTGQESSRGPANPSRAELLEALTVKVVDKRFSKADYMNGDYQDSIGIRLIYESHSDKDIRAFKGTLVFRDLFNDEIQRSELKEDRVLKAQQRINVERSLNYNQFIESNVRLRNTPLESLNIEWVPEAIVFSDGSSLAPK
jgi:hypothetical protein